MHSTHDFKSWSDYFIRNRNSLHLIPWKEAQWLSEKEFEKIRKSIAVFQKGESSDGKHLIQKAHKNAMKTGDKNYFDALMLFINEEHRHSFDLKRFMMIQGIPLLKTHWTDWIFRRLRNLGGLETSISVLLTAEIIATVYYDALSKATDSTVLKSICHQILEDEDMHIRFQSEGLSRFYVKRKFLTNAMIHLIRRILLEATMHAVWIDHRKVFKAGGYGFFSFRQSALSEFCRTIHIVQSVFLKQRLESINLKLNFVNK